MIDAVIKSSFLFSRKLMTLPFIKVFIPMVAPTIQTIIITNVNEGTKISVVNVILFILANYKNYFIKISVNTIKIKRSTPPSNIF